MNKIKLTFSSSTPLTAVVSSTSWVGYIAVYKLYIIAYNPQTNQTSEKQKTILLLCLQCKKLLNSLYLRHLTVIITIVIYWNAERVILFPSSSLARTKTNSCMDNRKSFYYDSCLKEQSIPIQLYQSQFVSGKLPTYPSPRLSSLQLQLKVQNRLTSSHICFFLVVSLMAAVFSSFVFFYY